MNRLSRLIGRGSVPATLCAAVFCAFAGPVLADEGSSTRSRIFSWNFNIDVGNQRSFGHNRTKGSGVVKEESRPVANFSRLVVALPVTVVLSQGPAESLSLSADDNLLPLLTTRVAGDELIIEGDKSRGFSTRNEIKVRLTVKSLNAIAIKGSGDVIGDQIKSDRFDIAIAGSGDVRFKSIRADEFKIDIKGSGDVTIDAVESKRVDTRILGSGDIRLPALQAASVSIAVQGSGDVHAAGQTDKVDVDIKGSGDVRARNLIAREASVKITASGDADVHAKEKLTAAIYGAGDIRYAGAPANVSRTVRGSGSIEGS